MHRAKTILAVIVVIAGLAALLAFVVSILECVLGFSCFAYKHEAISAVVGVHGICMINMGCFTIFFISKSNKNLVQGLALLFFLIMAVSAVPLAVELHGISTCVSLSNGDFGAYVFSVMQVILLVLVVLGVLGGWAVSK